MPDTDIISFCRDNGLVWVTKDWSAGIVDVRVAQLRREGVSVWWLREESRKQMQRPELLYVAARDIESAIFQVETARQPIYIMSSAGRKAREIRLPFRVARPTSATARAARRRVRPRRPRTGHEKLFPNV